MKNKRVLSLLIVGMVLLYLAVVWKVSNDQEVLSDYEVMDDIAVFTNTIDQELNEPMSSITSFSKRMSDMVMEHKDELSNGAIFQLRGRVVGGDGEMVMSEPLLLVYWEQDTLESYSPVNKEDDLYQMADFLYADEDYQSHSIILRWQETSTNITPEPFNQLLEVGVE